MTDKELIKQEIERRIKEGSSKNDISEGAFALNSLIDFIDTLPEEPASEDLEEYAKKLAKRAALDKHNLIWMCKKGAQWKDEQIKQLLIEKTKLLSTSAAQDSVKRCTIEEIYRELFNEELPNSNPYIK